MALLGATKGPAMPSQSSTLVVPHQHRRALLLSMAALAAASPPLRAPPAATAAPEALLVGPGCTFASIGAAMLAAAPGSTVLVTPGVYKEQLVVTQSVTLAAQQAGSVQVVCDTQQPYQHCLASSAAGIEVTVQGIAFLHYSKSVANNYAVFVQAGKLTLLECDISSRSGAGVGVEGAAAQLQQCRVHDCARQGVAVFGGLDGTVGRCDVVDCSVTQNQLDGVLAKDGSSLTLRGSAVQGNGGRGVRLSDCTAVLVGNAFSGNREGSIELDAASVDADLQQLSADNQLEGEVQRV